MRIPDQHPKILVDKNLIPYVRRYLQDWRPDPSRITGDELAQVEERLRLARSQAANIEDDVSKLIELLSHPKQLEALMSEFRAKESAHLIEQSLGGLLAERERNLLKEPRDSRLEIQIYLVIEKIDIPDAEREEVTFDINLYAGAELTSLLEYMVYSQLITTEEAEICSVEWRKNDMLIGKNERQKAAVDKCLQVSFSTNSSEYLRHISYNYGAESKVLWRNYNGIVGLAVPVDLDNYPLDRTFIELNLGADLDAGEAFLVPSASDDCALQYSETVAPRGFKVTWQSDDLISVTSIEDEDFLMSNYVVFGVELSRRPSTFIVRTLIPLSVIVLYGFVAAIAALTTTNNGLDVTQSILPAVLIAAVALQLTAVQSIPHSAGRTRLDEFFISIYMAIFILFLAMLMETNRFFSFTLIALSGIVIVVSMARLLWPRR